MRLCAPAVSLVIGVLILGWRGPMPRWTTKLPSAPMHGHIQTCSLMQTLQAVSGLKASVMCSKRSVMMHVLRSGGVLCTYFIAAPKAFIQAWCKVFCIMPWAGFANSVIRRKLWQAGATCTSPVVAEHTNFVSMPASMPPSMPVSMPVSMPASRPMLRSIFQQMLRQAAQRS